MARSVSFDIQAKDDASEKLIAVGRRLQDVEKHIDDLNRKRLKIDADTAQAERQLQVLTAEAREATGDRKLHIDADIEGVRRQLATLRDAKIKVDADEGAARAKLAELHHQVDRLDGRRININVDADTGAALGKIAAVGLALSALAPATAFLAGGVASIGIAGAGAFGVLKGSLAGVSDAVTAMGDASAQTGSSMKSNADAVARATHGVEVAQRGVTKALQDVKDAQMGVTKATEAVVDAQKAQARAADDVKDAQRGVADAERAVQDAERSLTGAQQDAIRVQQGLNDARKTAAERLQDLERQTKDMRLSEADAALAVAEAEANLNKVRIDPTATSLERQRAALSVAQAKQRQEDLSSQAKKLAEDKASADAKGVEGSDEVTAAQDRITQANQRVADAQRGVEQANRGVEDAQKGVNRAQDAYEQSTRKVRDARLGVEEAERRVKDAQQGVKDAQYNVLEAQRQVTEAMKQGGDQGSSSMNKLNQAMAGLTPEGRRFATFLRGVIDGPLKEIRDAGQRNLLPGLQSGIQSMLPYSHQLATSFGNIAKHMGDFFAQLGPHLGPALVQLARLADVASDKGFKDLGETIGLLVDKFTQWAQGQSTETIRQGVERVENVVRMLWQGLTLAWKGFQFLIDHAKDISIVSGAMLALRGAIVLVNLAMMANPVSLVIGALVLLGIGLYQLYQHSETFRNGVNRLWTVLKQGFQEVWTVLKPRLDELWKVIQENLIPAFKDFVRAMEPIVTFVVQKLWPIYAQVWGALISIVTGAIKIIAGIINVVTGLITGDWSKVWNGIKLIFSGIWTAIQGILRAAWNIIKGVLQGAYDWLKGVWSNVWGQVRDKISTAWNGVKTLLSSGWNWIRDNVFAKVKDGVSAVGTAFGKAKDAIGTAWDLIKEAAAKPVRFVVNTVFGGIVGKFNDLAGTVHIPKLPVPHVNFATGGPITGPGNGTSDQVPIMASNGEWVIREAAARRIGPRGMAAINQADRLDISGDPSNARIRKFAGGGEVTADQMNRVNAVRSWIPSVDPLPYIWGGVGPGGYDCSGLVGEVWARLTGRPSFRRYMTTNTILDSPGSLGLAPGPGLFSIGVSRTHTDGNLAGMAFEAASSKSGIKIGGAAKPVGSFPSVFHLANFGTAGAGDIGGGGGGGFSWNPLDWVKAGAKKVVDSLSGTWFKALGDMGIVGDLGVGAAKSLISGIFDGGGFLQPGLNLAYNGTGSPEPVLTSGQWSGVRQAAGIDSGTRRGGGGGDVIINVPIQHVIAGTEQQVAKFITTTVKSAVETGTIKFDTARR